MSIESAAAALPMLRALAAGKAAGRDEQPVTACPYSPDGDTAQERAQARMWLRGYAQTRPDTVDYSA
ncbi:hypothetical protein GCM10010402_66210 [Actinomadura luteofluorescens]|uniref:Rmf/CrpP fold protein n=1 Tax=Actinomadura luteofluorescens TaxID=46163 RepID=UPI0021644575|nr:Rmf/CrpP fold protein [Actinomadura glauciflava]MCR3744207.1 hypothetical protein [Actinomadura glauciflava]